MISWCGNFAERPETMRKLSLPAKFQHQKIRWNYGIFRSDCKGCCKGLLNKHKWNKRRCIPIFKYLPEEISLSILWPFFSVKMEVWICDSSMVGISNGYYSFPCWTATHLLSKCRCKYDSKRLWYKISIKLLFHGQVLANIIPKTWNFSFKRTNRSTMGSSYYSLRLSAKGYILACHLCKKKKKKIKIKNRILVLLVFSTFLPHLSCFFLLFTKNTTDPE